MIKGIIKDQEVLLKSKVWDIRTNQQTSISLVQDLEDTLESLTDRFFVCSNEIGYEERAIDVKFSDDSYIFMNPSFKSRGKMILNREKDVHNGKEYIIPRYSEIEIVYQDCLGSIKGNKLVDSAAVVMCQAMDLLNGLRASDYGLEIIPEFDEASEEERQEVIDKYLQSLSKFFNKLDKELSSNKETKEVWDAAKFIKGVSDGSIELEEDPPLSNRKKKKIDQFIKLAKQQKNRLKHWAKK